MLALSYLIIRLANSHSVIVSQCQPNLFLIIIILNPGFKRMHWCPGNFERHGFGYWPYAPKSRARETRQGGVLLLCARIRPSVSFVILLSRGKMMDGRLGALLVLISRYGMLYRNSGSRFHSGDPQVFAQSTMLLLDDIFVEKLAKLHVNGYSYPNNERFKAF